MTDGLFSQAARERSQNAAAPPTGTSTPKVAKKIEPKAAVVEEKGPWQQAAEAVTAQKTVRKEVVFKSAVEKEVALNEAETAEARAREAEAKERLAPQKKLTPEEEGQRWAKPGI